MPIATQSARRTGRALHQACLCAKVCDDFRGEDTRVLDLTGVTPIFDYFVITSGNSRRQMVAIAEEADKVMAGEGSDRLGIEGHEGGSWILHDFGDVVLHVFDAEARKTYSLEALWADAVAVDWREILNNPPADAGI
jgi:ribosome-associated protein